MFDGYCLSLIKVSGSIRPVHYISGDLEEAAKIAGLLLTDFPAEGNMLHSLCMTLAFNYAYGGLRDRPQLKDFSIDNSSIIEQWLKAAIQCYQQNAEPYFLLGELYNLWGDLVQAEQDVRESYAAAH